MTIIKNSLALLFLCFYQLCFAQNVPILSYQVNNFGQVQLEIEGSADEYYLLTALHEPNLNTENITSITMGEDGNMFVSEPLAAYDLASYKITAHPIANPVDSDGDGINDIEEFNNMPTNAPLNHAEAIDFIDGTTSIDDLETFQNLSVVEDVPWAPFLNGTQFVKFGILDRDTDEPKVYFINSNTYSIHANFFAGIGANVTGDDGSGEIVYNPNEILPNGAIGSYSFNFSFGDALNFEDTQRTFELLAANMPFLRNNLQHFIGNGGENIYNNLYKDDYIGSRINVVLESEVFADVDFLPFNQAEGYGFFRHMQLDENPGSRDIVLYDALPNSLPRVGGIITSVVQTPLSHVNLRAIQDNLPNAYIRDPLLIDSIANLLDKYIYYKVEQDSYTIREATLEEVNEWYEKLRPTEDQIPERDLSQTEILPLDEIEFEMSNAFGAKCTNVATMRTFGFPDGTIPDGFGIPFYFYDEFMKYNGFYDDVEEMINNPDFISDLETRIEMLKDFRKEIKDANMPQWMLDDLQVMHDAFPEGTAVRVRSSTNNEDLPGFSGAGLYTSKTQHLDEGHISKSVKQVYASIWNFRAFDERDFYRVDHFIAAMGLLCHPNFEDEKSNGVGVSLDPIFETQNTYYLNTQVGEALITNPNANEIPEEILLNVDPAEGYFVLRYSNLVPTEELVMDETHLNLLRDYLKVIHDEFAILYNVVGAEGYGMDIEYKVTVDDQLIVKQARPWVSFWAEIKSNFDLETRELIAPISGSNLTDSELVTVKVGNSGLRDMKDFDLSLTLDGQFVETITISDELNPQSEGEYEFTIPLDLSLIKDYEIGLIVDHEEDGYSPNDTLITTVSNLYQLEGGISAELKDIKCGSIVEAKVTIANYGAASFADTNIEIVANGSVVEVYNYDFTIPSQSEVDLVINVSDNLQASANEITFNLLNVNGQMDALQDNNSASFMTDLDAEFDQIILEITADDYPEEISWDLREDGTNDLVDSGSLIDTDVIYTREICLDINKCYTLYVNDSFGDGLCCQYGNGFFTVYGSAGEILAFNNGQFSSNAEESFCVGDVDCLLTASIDLDNASTSGSSDGSISINASNGSEPYQYSIDGGMNYLSTSVFNDLPAQTYSVQVLDADGCLYAETVELDFDIMSSTQDLAFESLKLFPNPTYGEFVIEIDNVAQLGDDFKIEIFNNLGQLLEQKTNLTFDGQSQTKLSLASYQAGGYLVKCSNREAKRYFKLIKI